MSTSLLVPAFAPSDGGGRVEAVAATTPLVAADAGSIATGRVQRSTSIVSRLAMTLTVVARMTAPNRNDSSACRSTVRRILWVVMSVSDTWNVIPIVNAVYTKSR